MYTGIGLKDCKLENRLAVLHFAWEKAMNEICRFQVTLTSLSH